MPRSTLTWKKIYIYIYGNLTAARLAPSKKVRYTRYYRFLRCAFLRPRRAAVVYLPMSNLFSISKILSTTIYIYMFVCKIFIYIYIYIYKYILNVYCIYACVCTYANHKCICFSYCTPFDSVFPLLSYDFMVYLFHRLQLSLLELCCTFHVFHVVY